jgi:hypothetical protein
MKLPHRSLVINDMLQDMTAIDHIKRLVRILDVCDVHLYHRTWIQQISRNVAISQQMLKTMLKAFLWSDMQHCFLSAIEQVCLLTEIKPHKAIALQAAAKRALGIFTRQQSISRKSARGSATYGTPPPFPTIQQPQNELPRAPYRSLAPHGDERRTFLCH